MFPLQKSQTICLRLNSCKLQPVCLRLPQLLSSGFPPRLGVDQNRMVDRWCSGFAPYPFAFIEVSAFRRVPVGALLRKLASILLLADAPR